MKSPFPVLAFVIGLFTACSTPETHKYVETRLTDTYWKLAYLSDRTLAPVEGQREAHFILQAQSGRVVGSGGCNRLMGSFRTDGQQLAFGKMAGTMMACPNLEDERAFLEALGKTDNWRIDGTRLLLHGRNKELLAEFEAVPVKK